MLGGREERERASQLEGIISERKLRRVSFTSKHSRRSFWWLSRPRSLFNMEQLWESLCSFIRTLWEGAFICCSTDVISCIFLSYKWLSAIIHAVILWRRLTALSYYNRRFESTAQGPFFRNHWSKGGEMEKEGREWESECELLCVCVSSDSV